MPQSVRHINEIRVLRALFEQEGMSRADLARQLGLTRSTIGNIVNNLVASGSILEKVIAEDAEGSARIGRPSQGLELNREHACFIGADIGAERLNVAALDLMGKDIGSLSEAYDFRSLTPEEVIVRVCDLIKGLTSRLDIPSRLRGLCVTLPGLVDRQGTLIRAPAIGWRNVPVKDLIHRHSTFDGRILIENDANAFAAGELFRGRLPEKGNTLFALLETGVGGAIVSDGYLLRGNRGYAGEIGHIFIGDTGYSNISSMPGTLESFVGLRGLLARDRIHGGQAETLGDFIEAVKAGHPAALKAKADWSHWLGRGLAALVSILDPESIVIGGSLVALIPFAEKEIVQAIVTHLLPGHPHPLIRTSERGADGPAIGGAVILLRDFLAIDEQVVFAGTENGVTRSSLGGC